VALRGNTTFLPPVHHENFIFVSGCAPASGVKADTKIVEDLKKIFMEFDISSLTLLVPDVFDSFSGQDASFEILVSGTAQVLKLHFLGDLVEKSIVVIFVTDRLKAPESRRRLKDLPYTDAVKKGTKYEQLFKLLGVDEVIIRLNRSKAEMVTQLDGLKAISDEFEKTATGQSRLLLGIVTLGFKLDPMFQKEFIDEIIPDNQECPDGTKMTKQFLTTIKGELLNVPYHAQILGRNKRTRVILLDDFDPSCMLAMLPRVSEYLKPDTAQLNPKPDSRSGNVNVQYYPQTEIDALLEHFTKEKKQNERKVFFFPKDLSALAERENFEGIKDTNPFLLDTEKILKTDLPLVKAHTFTKQTKMSETYPKRITSEIIKSSFSSTISYQPTLGLILSFSGHPTDKSAALLSIHLEEEPFELVQKLNIPLEHFDYAMVPVDHLTAATNTFFFGLCTIDSHATPFKLFKCEQEKKTEQWNLTAPVEVRDTVGET